MPEPFNFYVAVVVACSFFQWLTGSCEPERRFVAPDLTTCRELVRIRDYGRGYCLEVWNETELRWACGGRNASCEPPPNLSVAPANPIFRRSP